MELHHVRYFVVLARELNYTTAAQRCSITRQAMRQALQSLEREFSLTFIQNQRNHLSLTPAGELFYQKCQGLLAESDALENALLAYSLKNLTLRLGVSISLLPFYAPRLLNVLNNLKDPFPTLKVERTLADADTLLESLRRGELDAVILVDMGSSCHLPQPFQGSPGSPGSPKGPQEMELSRTLLRRDEMGFLVSMKHPAAQKTSLTLKDLSGQTLVLMSRPQECFSPLYQALREREIPVTYEVIPETYEAFQTVRKEGVLAINRLPYKHTTPLALEKDLPLSDLSLSLETVLLFPKNPLPGHSPLKALSPLAHYLERSCRESFHQEE